MKISDINWGDDSAEKDNFLLEYFVTSDAFRRLSSRTKHIVVGRKGSGKSALLRKLSDVFSKQENTYVVKILPKYNSIRSVLNDNELAKAYGHEIFFQHTWLRQIYLDALCVIGNSAKGKFSSGSMEFARDVAKQQSRTTKDMVENISDVVTRLRVKAGKLGDLGIDVEKSLKDVSQVESLEHHLTSLSTEGAKFVILLDDLDLGWDNSAIANNMLLGLLTAINHICSLHRDIHPIVFLREDIYSILLEKTQHADKFRNVERLRWDKTSLIEILESRINFNRKIAGDPVLNSGAFSTVFPEAIGTANSDNWLVERTLSRPRELIQLVRYYSEKVASDTPSSDRLKDAEPDYSSWKLDDLCAEYSNQYPGLVAVMAYWKGKFFRHKYHLKRDEIEVMLLEVATEINLNTPWFNEIVDNTDIPKFIKILYEIGFVGDFVLGGQGGSRTIYSYEERHEPRLEEVQIHPCFRRAVNTVERIRS